MHRGSVATEVKEEKLNRQVDGLERNLEQISDQLERLMPKRVFLDLEPFIVTENHQQHQHELHSSS